MDLDSVAQELYGLPLNEFVPTRNARAKEARAAGDRELAGDIQALTKPTVAAWLVNQLPRQHPTDLDALLDLGRELRDASAKLDAETMRDLGGRRNELVSDLLTRARDVGAEHDYRVSDEVADEVRQTLESTLSESTIADDVAAGRLSRSVEYAGFGESVGLGGPTGIVGKPRPDKTARQAPKQPPTAKPSKTAKTADRPSQPTDLTTRRRQRAEREVSEAAQRLKVARASRDEAADEFGSTTAEVETAEAEVERLRAELAAAERAAKSARQASRAAQQRLSIAEREVGGIERMHERAQTRLTDLDS